LRLASLALLLGLVSATSATAGVQPDRHPSDQPAEAGPSSRPSDEEPSWEIQFAGHGGAAGLSSRGEVRLAIASSVGPVDETVGYSRERSWGAGLRVIRGRWGVEVQHHRVASRGFMPAAMMRETPWFGAEELPLTDSADDLLSVFAVREFPLVQGRARFHLAAGGGYLLMGGDSGRLVLEDLAPGISRMATFGGASHETAIEMTEGDFRADRGVAVLYSGPPPTDRGRDVSRFRLRDEVERRRGRQIRSLNHNRERSETSVVMVPDTPAARPPRRGRAGS